MVVLEPISNAHFDLVLKYASDKRISDTSNVPHPYTREMAEEWFKAVSKRQEIGQSKVFAIIYESNFAGVISLNNIQVKLRAAEVDYWVAVIYQGKGVATLALAEALKYGEKHLGLKKFVSSCLKRNVASLSVQRKNGFKVIKIALLESGKFTGEEYVTSMLELV
jgi:[ribosomal protein S5]-alanine N-acetyltransferase